CRWHHHLKTYCGYRLEGSPGDWRLVAPDHPPDHEVGVGAPEARQPETLDLGLAGVAGPGP
ncbi:MAG: hypothetical protein ACR2HV_05265, partial [Acidimicrobiales bacterium]